MKTPHNFFIKQNAKLSEYTTFQLGGPCKGLVSCTLPEEVCEIVDFFNQEKLPFMIIGGGSNLVVSDSGLDYHVIRFFTDTPLIQKNGTKLIVTGSTRLDDLAQFSAENGLEGLNTTSGIPGTVGGAIVGNAGAFGKQIGDVVHSVTLLTSTGIKKEVQSKDLRFSYRDSILKKTNDIVLSATLALKSSDMRELKRERKKILTLRQEKHPNLKIHPCAGSFFRNIEPTSKAEQRQAAGWFLEQAGVKELKVGGATIFPKHANIIITTKNGTSQNVYDLSLQMAQKVKEKFNLDLIREVKFIGDFNGKKVEPKPLMRSTLSKKVEKSMKEQKLSLNDLLHDLKEERRKYTKKKYGK